MPGPKTAKRIRKFALWGISLWALFVTIAAVYGWMYGIAATNAMERFIAADQEHTNHDYKVSVDLPNPITGLFHMFSHFSLTGTALVALIVYVVVSKIRARRKAKRTTPAAHTSATSAAAHTTP